MLDFVHKCKDPNIKQKINSLTSKVNKTIDFIKKERSIVTIDLRNSNDVRSKSFAITSSRTLFSREKSERFEIDFRSEEKLLKLIEKLIVSLKKLENTNDEFNSSIRMCLQFLESPNLKSFMNFEDGPFTSGQKLFKRLILQLIPLQSGRISSEIASELVADIVDCGIYDSLFYAQTPSKSVLEANSSEFKVQRIEIEENLVAKYCGKSELKLIEITNANFLGITIKTSHFNIVVERVLHGSLSHKLNLFSSGDEILEVNGTQMKCLSVESATKLLKDSNIKVRVLYSKNLKKSLKDLLMPKIVEPIYIRALYDYNPRNDDSLDIKELGVPFQCGDILKVVDYQDSMWWQAYKYENKSQNIAGIVPSKFLAEE
ncbi:MAG: Maguk P55 subfamily member [Paramarteilia canceri]